MSDKPKDTLYINVEYSTEDEEYGPVYVAYSDEVSLVTDGKTFSELLKNLREAIALCLEDIDTVAQYNLVPNPRIKLIMELPENYAEIA